MKIRPTRAVGGKAKKGGYSFDNACVAFGKTDEVRQKNTKKKIEISPTTTIFDSPTGSVHAG